MLGPEFCCSVFAVQLSLVSTVTKLSIELYKIKLFVSLIETVRAYPAVGTKSINVIHRPSGEASNSSAG
jgi:hypothetical protein